MLFILKLLLRALNVEDLLVVIWMRFACLLHLVECPLDLRIFIILHFKVLVIFTDVWFLFFICIFNV